MQIPLIRLECATGKVGTSSAAAKFASATNFKPEDGKPYAEDVVTQRSLLDLVQDNQALLSSDIASRYGNKLPFLFKVLSISKALSIQAHPNKKLAEQLHAKDSKNYPDDNHKPEMTIAVTPFDGLCGFRPLAEIAHLLETVKPLRELVGEDAASDFQSSIKGHETDSSTSQTSANKKALQKAFTALMANGQDTSRLAKASTALVAAAKSEGADFAGGRCGPTSGKELSELVVRLDGQFPKDVGLFVFFFLNYIKLEVGEAMFLKADDIHAYLSGDIIECMASSDNVVRAGFTPKYKDVSTLTEMLTYSYAPIEEQKMSPADYTYVKFNTTAYSSQSTAILYDPPIEEFAVVKTDLQKEGAKATFESIDGPSIVICTSGEGTISVGPKTEEIKTGYVYFVGATAELVLESKGEEFTTFKAFCELGSTTGAHANGNLATTSHLHLTRFSKRVDADPERPPIWDGPRHNFPLARYQSLRTNTSSLAAIDSIGHPSPSTRDPSPIRQSARTALLRRSHGTSREVRLHQDDIESSRLTVLALRPKEVSDLLKLDTVAKNHTWKVEPSCATTGEGIFEGLVQAEKGTKHSLYKNGIQKERRALLKCPCKMG
ncbi:hypothetical protein FH972_023323 [Carpinus fangiana]|uniref:Mannose-6-phosphate isomerase n=1 Tax=Carpinus fangiana TaxID=176857 RepID=A0A5N6KUW2_9ROSI|nr:hypothetical protein FH972_023323 [Carpinus fangiana]